ncbi:MAG: pyruvate ferredoxin oxidoreductase [Acidobacteria bacterium]|nr:pyruvate ferredoxin oxidoreductase [Acidobacteriota bacterium]
MAKIVATTGNSAMAYAMKQVNPDVCAAYPITPSTQVVEEFSQYVADGQVKTNFVTVESEHSAMSACIGAAAAGGRVMTATSSQGLALMWEMLYIAAGMRLPIVLSVINRALSAPINIHCDHGDSFGARDSGCLQFYGENAQEAYDNLIQAVRVAEHLDVRLPALVMQDGFIISHSIERMEYLEDKEVQDFVGGYKPLNALLDLEHPVTLGALDLQDYYIEHRRQMTDGMHKALPVIKEVAEDFRKLTGRAYGYFEEYRLEDAEIGLVVLNSSAGTAKDVIDAYRKRGIRAGLLKPRVFRPFPAAEYADALKHLKAITVLDRVDSVGAHGGPLFMELRSTLYDCNPKPIMINKIYGLGGRDLEEGHCNYVLDELVKIAETGEYKTLTEFITVRD